MATSNTDAPSAQLQASLERLNHNIENLTESLGKKSSSNGTSDEDKTQANGKTASRATVAAAMALLGFKLIGLVGAKIGWVYSLLTDKKPQDVLEVEALGKSALRQVTHATTGGIVGGIVGILSFGMLGWKRADRISDSADLIKHPIDSLAKIFGDTSSLPESPPVKKHSSSLPSQHHPSAQLVDNDDREREVEKLQTQTLQRA